MDQKYIDFFLNCSLDVMQVETIEISHPSFTETRYLVRNSLKPFTAKDENGVTKTYLYAPMQINASPLKDNMDASIEINLGDVGTIIGIEIERMDKDDTFDIEPKLIYRLYRSDDKNSPMLISKLDVTDLVMTRDGCKITARAPKFNVNKTGERYTISRFPMLRGVL